MMMMLVLIMIVMVVMMVISEMTMTIPWTTLATTKEGDADDGDNLYDFDNYEEGEREGDDDEEKREHCEQARAHPWTLVASWGGASIKIYFVYTYICFKLKKMTVYFLSNIGTF